MKWLLTFVYVALSVGLDIGIINYVHSPFDIVLVIVLALAEIWGFVKLLASTSESE